MKDVDNDILKTLDRSAVSYQIVLTKADQVKAAELEQRIAETIAALKTHPAAYPEILTTSSRTGAGMTGKILVLTAIDNELSKARAPEGVEVIYTGVGKVNAASAATLALLVLRPSLVINYGTAGKINEKLRGLVEVADVIQRDMGSLPMGISVEIEASFEIA